VCLSLEYSFIYDNDNDDLLETTPAASPITGVVERNDGREEEILNICEPKKCNNAIFIFWVQKPRIILSIGASFNAISRSTLNVPLLPRVDRARSGVVGLHGPSLSSSHDCHHQRFGISRYSLSRWDPSSLQPTSDPQGSLTPPTATSTAILSWNHNAWFEEDLFCCKETCRGY
jgi:hypothetical protein